MVRHNAKGYRCWCGDACSGVSLIIGLSLLCITGCGKGKSTTYPASGKVTFEDGSPLTGGWVAFRTKDIQPAVIARGPINTDGEFVLSTFAPNDGAIAGRHQVIVTSPRMIQRSGFKQPLPALPVDNAFSGYETSGLEFEVKAEPEGNRFQIGVAAPKR